MAWIAAIASALIGAASQADASSTAAGGQAAAAQNAKNKPQGGDFTPSAEKFAPGVSGTGDGSMPVKSSIGPVFEGNVAGSPGAIFSQKPAVQDSLTTPTPEQQPPPQQPAQADPNAGKVNATDYAALAQAGVGLAQAFQGQSPPPMQPAQVGGQGYTPTALQMLQMLAEKKKQLGYR